MASITSWSELPEELLSIIIAGLADPADCARFRAVCGSWHSVPSPRRRPWIAPSPLPKRMSAYYKDYSPFRVIPFPDNVRCIGSTDSWLAICVIINAEKNRHTYALHNIFSETFVMLPELDAVLRGIPNPFQVRKVLMQSPPTGLVAIGTNNGNYPIILVRPGKGVWSPDPREAVSLAPIIDIEFFGDKLYGITMDEELISLCISVDSQGTPTVTGIEHVIMKHQIGADDVDVSNDQGNNNIEAENNGAEDDDEVDSHEALGEYGEEEHPIGDDGQFGDNGETTSSDEDENEDKVEEVPEGMYVLDGVDIAFEGEYNEHIITTIWNLVESCGKLFMVRRRLQDLHLIVYFTREVEVFEADASTRMWVPVSGGLDGQALFISKRFSKSLAAGGDIEKDVIYFIDSGEAFNMRSKTITAPSITANFGASWLFLPGSF